MQKLSYVVFAYFLCTVVYGQTNTGSINSFITRQFSKTIANIQKLRTFAGVSITDCEDECKHRRRCTAVLFNRRATVCTLVSSWRRDHNVTEGKGMAYETGFYGARTHLSACNNMDCDVHETCLPDDNGDTCKPTECDQPPSIYTNYNGNMYSVNNRLSVAVDGTTLKILCGKSGIWIPVSGSLCLPGWRYIDDACYWVDLEQRNQAQARKFCEQLGINAYLAVIKSATENTAVSNWLETLPNGQDLRVWLNGKINVDDGRYYWGDGTAFSESFTYWGQGEPSLRTRWCMGIRGDLHFYWGDEHCVSFASSLCKQPI